MTDVVTSREAADLLMVDPRTIQRLTKDGYIQRKRLGRYLTTSVVQGYIRWLKEERKSDSRISAENRMRKARARQFEVQADMLCEKLASLDEFDETLDELIGELRKGFAGMPARVTRDPDIRRSIVASTDALFDRVSVKK